MGEEYNESRDPNVDDDEGEGHDHSNDYTDLSLDEEDDPLPRKFKFPNMRKYSGTDDPHLHLK